MVLSVGKSATVVVPIYNEIQRIPSTIGPILRLAAPHMQIVLVDDGSNDGTREFLERSTVGVANVSLIRLPCNRGKGAAVRAGMAVADGDLLAFMDADLATDLDDLASLLDTLEDHDVAIGSRATKGAVIEQGSLRRKTIGNAFNRFVRHCSGLPYHDTQCGFKAFRAHTGRLLFSMSRLSGFAFDVELLALASALGCRIKEVPVHWTEIGGSHVRPIRDPTRMALDVLRLHYFGRRRMASVGSVSISCALGEEGAVTEAVRAAAATHHVIVTHSRQVHALVPFAPNGEAGTLCDVLVAAGVASRRNVIISSLAVGDVLRLAHPTNALLDVRATEAAHPMHVAARTRGVTRINSGAGRVSGRPDVSSSVPGPVIVDC